MNNKKMQEGFSLFEVILVMGLMSIGYILLIQSQAMDTENIQARNLGAKLHEYQTSARKYATINASNDDLVDSENINVGSSWLKLAGDCVVPGNLDPASGEYGIINCSFPDSLITGIGSTSFSSTVTKGELDEPLIIKTVIDMTSLDAQGNTTTILSDSALTLTAITATGGSFSSSLSLSGNNITSVEPYMSSTSSKITYCQLGFEDSMLSEDCTVNGVVRKGSFVMTTEAHPQLDSWVRTDGGNTMNNNLTFNEETPDQFREIVNVNRLYNITGKALKLGNSGIFDEDDTDWSPVLGNGVVIDTDAKVVGNITVDGDIETKGEIYADGDIVTEGHFYSNEGISTLGDVDVAGNVIVLGTGLFQNGISVIGETSTDTAYVNGFLEAQEVYSRGNVYANTAVSAPYVRASVGLFSEGDLLVSKDSFIGGNQYIEGDTSIKGNLYAEGDIIANQGAAYLGTVFADMVFDNNGNYLLDPSDISRVNVMRANRYAAGTTGGTLNMNADKILFAAENDACTSASESCATSLEGFWDMESLFVKRESTNQWVRLVDWLTEINNTQDEINDNLEEVIDDYDNNVNTDHIECWPVYGGVYFKGKFIENGHCP